MQQLWLLRHGDAEPHGTRADSDRRLTGRGEQQSRDAGTALAALGLGFAQAWTSPKVRARDTARLAGIPLGIQAHEDRSLYAGFGVDDARRLLLGADDGERVLVVGHEPDFSQVVYDLTGARVDVKKGGVAGVRIAGGHAELIVLLRPREVSAIAAGVVVG